MSASYSLPKVEYDLLRLEGGLDLLTPSLALAPGYCRDAQNFEVSVNSGYTRIPGYERYDGHTAPTAATWGALVLGAVANVTVGQTINVAANTAVVIAIVGTTLIYTKQVGSFAIGDTVLRGGLTVGVVTATGASFDARTQAQYRALAADSYRADIAAVPGSGPVRGVLAYNGQVYAWRNNAGASAMAIYRASSLGWVQVALGWELSYTAGSAAIAEGATVTGLASGATGVARRQLVRTGTLAGSTAAGTLVLSATTGTFTAGEALQVGGVTRATASGTAVAITLAAGGRVQTVIGNFGSGTRVYGCDGVNAGFEFDGTYYVPIRTGMPADTPTAVAVHNSALFFAFGSSVQFSSVNTPYAWSAIFGAGEFLTREPVTAMISMLGSDSTSALAIYARDSTSVLYGTGSIDYRLAVFNASAGAERYTAQRMETAYALDERGVMSLAATDKFGNFDTATLTYNIRPWVQGRRTSATASGLNREKSQYRVWFSDGSGLYITIVNGQYMGSMPVYFPNPVLVWCEGEIGSGVETSFFGSDNGFVYRLDVGPSFDGAAISGRLQLNYNPSKSPRVRKRYRRASVEVTGTAFAEFQYGYDLGYGLADNEQPLDVAYQNRFTSSNWDSFFWDAFTWDGKTLAPSEVEMTGTAENVALRISTGTNYIEEFTLNSVILHFSIRRGLR